MRTTLLRLGSSLIAALSLGCLNADPLPYYPPDTGAPDVEVEDVDEDASSDGPDARAVCRACIEAPVSPGPGCENDYQACVANDKCALMFECILAKGCASLSTQPDIINCALPCVAEAGAVNIGDPAVQLILPIAPCVLGPCHPACGMIL